MIAFYMFKKLKKKDVETSDVKTKIKLLGMKTSTSKMGGKIPRWHEQQINYHRKTRFITFKYRDKKLYTMKQWRSKILKWTNYGEGIRQTQVS